ncbi:MAG: hypothetical protein HYS12_03340 [Planctomycetes bacterium]|nr:hypothetical protein [Planctomycetota bacterium]
MSNDTPAPDQTPAPPAESKWILVFYVFTFFVLLLLVPIGLQLPGEAKLLFPMLLMALSLVVGLGSVTYRAVRELEKRVAHLERPPANHPPP